MTRLGLAMTTFLSFAGLAAGGDVGFLEDFALARDRTAALKQLIPGTEEYYYFHALHELSTEQFDKAEARLKPWLEKFGRTERVIEIETRHALLTYDRDPKKSLQYLRERLGVSFDHQRQVSDGPPNLPTAFDPKRITREILQNDSFNRWGLLENYEDSALDWLSALPLNADRRRNLLQRLTRPDAPNLPKLIVADLAYQNSGGFGSLNIHRQLTLVQLEELLKLKPELLNQTAFVQIYLSKLQPGADEDWRHDPAKLLAFYERQQAFVARLAAAHNPLTAHVLYHRLVLDRARGVFDKALFTEYLKLPRQQGYMAKALLESDAARRFPASLESDFSGQTLLPPVHADEDVVRSYLKHFFLEASSPKEFEPFINDVYLKHLFAETKIEAGLGEPEQWAAALPPEMFAQLKERIDIDFAPTNKAAFKADEAVTLDLFVKNVPTLIVKVFEINAANYYREMKKEIDTDINLDGLVANAEKTYTYAEPALRRMGRKFEFPQLTKPGVYIVDFIGSGKSSRALIRKGKLRPLVTVSTAGQLVRIVDDNDKPAPDATLWLGGTEYAPDDKGMILVPFSTSPGRQPVVLRRGDVACLEFLQHPAEAYSLTAGIHVDREALLTQKIATVLVRPGLYLNGKPVSIKLLDEAKLRITATDHNGISTSTEVPNFKLFEDRESSHEVRVPPRLATLTVTLGAKVKNLSTGKPVDLASGESFTLGRIATTDKIEDLHLAKFGNDYVIELLGRSGEPKPDRPVQLSVKHRDFREAINATLKSDLRGRVMLGELKDIVSVTAANPEGVSHAWTLPLDRCTYRQVVHAKAGEVVTLPYIGAAAAASREEFALFEVTASTIRADVFSAVSLKNGSIELAGLAAGDYDLWLKRSGEHVRIRVVAGPVEAGHVLGQLRHLELPGLKPVQIAAITADETNLTIRLRDASAFARVHVYATRYVPAYSAFADFAKVRDAELTGVMPAHASAAYLTGRNIGDEYRYVLDRRYQKRYPGNMLDRPALLLNPWAVRTTETGEQLAEGGQDYRQAGVPPAMVPLKSEAERGVSAGGGNAPGEFADLDFLASGSALLENLTPDKDGVVTVARKGLGTHAILTVVAIDPLHTVVRTVTLPELVATFNDLRLRLGLDPKGHFAQQKQVTIVPPGQPFVLEDAAGGKFEAFDSLPKVYGLFTTLMKDPKLAEFAFLTTWPTLKPEEKRTQYSKYACHELSFFLMKKDPEFFKTVIAPYLANKKDKTFLDHWMLDADLKEYAQPWQYGRLNIVERILLAQRLPGEPAKTSRHLADLLKLVPQNLDATRLHFDTALLNGALGEDQFGLQAQQLLLKAKMAADPQAAAGMMFNSTVPAPAGPGGGNLGGGGGFGGGRLGGENKPATMPAEAGKARAANRDGATKKLGLAKDQSEKGEGDALRKEAAAGDGVQNYFGEDRAAGRRVAQLYRRIEATQEWAENNYYKLLISQQLADLVAVSPFWVDYAKHDGKSPFLSQHLAEAGRNFTEVMLALAVLDLPFEAKKADVKFNAGKMTLTPAGVTVAFHEEVRPVAAPAGAVPILVSQNFFKANDRYRDEAGEKVDKFVTNEFVVHTVYGSQVVVTNPSPARQKLSVLIQVPVGSIALANSPQTRSVMLDLEPYRTQTIDTLFYFPKAGTFNHFPVHVAKNEVPVAAAVPVVFNVVDKATKADTESWEYISQSGTMEQVLAYLTRENVFALNLDRIAFRMNDAKFLEAVLALLHERHLYQPTLWSYAIVHNNLPAARQYFLHADQIATECGGPIASPLLTVDPVARHLYEHLEYKPLVNARAHSLGKRRQIVNDRFHAQYHAFLKTLSYRRDLNDDDKLAVAYYLLLQDRIEEATDTFKQVAVEKVATKMQYDYCAAYLDMFNDEPKAARAIAEKYAALPVDRWRNAFAAIRNQLDEIDGKGLKAADADDRDQKQAAQAAKEPAFEFTLDNKAIQLTYQNVETIRVNYYLMDVELLFSRNPFVQQTGNQFGFIKPNESMEVKLPAGAKFAVPLPEQFAKRNVLVEVTAAGKTRSLPYYATAMDVKLTENYGQLRVLNAAGKPLAKVYVKTYVRTADGQVKFHKDGYTDLRGRFDYATVSTPDKSAPARFSILVLSEDAGATIREAAPPQQ